MLNPDSCRQLVAKCLIRTAAASVFSKCLIRTAAASFGTLTSASVRRGNVSSQGRRVAHDSATDSAKEFLYHPFTLSKSIICRFYNSKRGLWGRSSRKWLFSLSKTHSGRMFFISFLTSGPKTYHWSVLRPEVRNENVGSPLGELSAAVRIKHLAKKSRIVL